MVQNKLYLHEEILLLALKDEKGTIHSGTMYQYAIGGALLSELLLHKRVRVVDSRWKKLVEATDSTPIGDPLLDECLHRIVQSKRRASLETWVSRFAHISKLKHRIASKLCASGILRAEEDKVLLIFTRKIYPEINPLPENEIIERIRQAIFTDTIDIDPRTIILIALTKHADILRVLFGRSELRPRKKRIKDITEGNVVGEAARDAIQAVQAAAAIAAIMPAIIAASTTAST